MYGALGHVPLNFQQFQFLHSSQFSAILDIVSHFTSIRVPYELVTVFIERVFRDVFLRHPGAIFCAVSCSLWRQMLRRDRWPVLWYFV